MSMDEETLPKFDYYLDESDPDIVVLRRQDGAFVAAFSARGATKEGIEEAAKEDYAKLVEAPASVSPPMTHHSPMRWYNPKLDHFEWREVPPTDGQALEVLDGSPLFPACAETYREWRQLGASIRAALIRAGEAAQAERELVEKGGADPS
jgi:hypothetical protein